MFKPTINYGVACLVMVSVMELGCASPRDPIYMDQSFSPLDVQTITVLPAVDFRRDRAVRIDEIELQKLVAEVLGRSLREKQYEVTFPSELWVRPCLEIDDIAEVDASCVKMHGPKEARWVLLVLLENLQKRTAFGSGVRAEVSGLLFDTSHGRVVWRDSGQRRLGQGGMVGVAMGGLLDKTVLQESVVDLMETFPRKSRE